MFTLFMSGCEHSGESANTPQEMFEYVIAKPIPSSIKGLEGGGYTWQGYSIFLRFTADASFIEMLLNKKYSRKNWDQVKSRFDLPSELKRRFSSPWNPAALNNKQCFEKEYVSNDWTGGGTHYFVVDENTYTVYFYGMGT